jgi:RecA-family ATPase
MVKNSEFLSAAYGPLGDTTFGWTCAFTADPHNAPPDIWSGSFWRATDRQVEMLDRRGEQNTYFSVSRLTAPKRSKSAFHSLAVLVADDADPTEINGRPSYVIETSPGNHQIGVFLDPTDPATRDLELIDRLMSAMADARLIKADASGNNAVRYCRLPIGRNTKGGAAHEVRTTVWTPDQRLTLDDAASVFGIDLSALEPRQLAPAAPASASEPDWAGLVQQVVTGEAYHGPLLSLSAKLAASGAGGGAIVNLLRGLMDAAPDRSDRWQSRYHEIPRMVSGADRYRPAATAPVTITLGGSQTAPERPSDLAPLDWSALAGTAPEPPEWLVQGWMPRRTTTLLAANGGVGKSNLSLQLAACLGLGRPFMSIDPVAPCRVLVLSAEDEARTVHFRLANIAGDLGVELAELEGRVYAYDLTQQDCVLWRDGAPTARMQWLADTVARHEAAVVIIDNASDVFSANENDRAEVRGFMRSLNAIAHASGAGVLLLAHVDKASVRMGAGSDTNSTFSGSTAWNNSARSRWAMTREEDAVTLRHEKCNFGALQPPIRLEFDSNARVFKRFGEVTASAAARNVLRSSNRGAILKLLSAAIQAGQHVSMHKTANNSAWNVLSGSKNFPKIDKRDFYSVLFDMQREGLITVTTYEKNRRRFESLAMTAAGLEETAPAWER